ITHKDSAHPFVPPPAGDMVIDFMNNLGYPEELQFVSKMYVNSPYQSWRTILSMINQCLTGKTSGGDKPKYPVLQMLWRVVTGTNVDYAELIWEEFVQAIKNFFSDVANLKSPVHITADDYPLGNLKFVSKGGVDEVFGMPITKDLITDAIRNSEYYKKYLEMAARKPCQPTTMIDEEGGRRRKLQKLGASTRPSAQPQDDTSVNVVKDTLSPVNSTNDAETNADMEQSTSKADTKILYVEEERGEEVSNMVALEEKAVELDEGQAGSDLGKTLKSQPPPEREHMEEDQAVSDLGQSHVTQARPNPEPMHKDFIVTVYPKVHESLKLTTEEHDAFTFVTVPIRQASSSIPPLSTPIINLSPPKLVLPLVQEHIFSTTTLPPPLPLPPQSTTDPDLATRIFALEKRSAGLEKKNQL
ncbi:hypothetical protein Tco_1117250, partial [Tanacetum coccineum]